MTTLAVDSANISWEQGRTGRKSPRHRHTQVGALWVEEAVAPLSGEVEACIRRLHELSRLPVNWDSYGSSPPTSRAVDASTRLLGVVDFSRMPRPFIGPASGGGIEFSWEGHHKALEIAVGEDGSAEYLALEEGAQPSEGQLRQTIDFRVLIDWFTEGE